MRMSYCIGEIPDNLFEHVQTIDEEYVKYAVLLKVGEISIAGFLMEMGARIDERAYVKAEVWIYRRSLSDANIAKRLSGIDTDLKIVLGGQTSRQRIDPPSGMIHRCALPIFAMRHP